MTGAVEASSTDIYEAVVALSRSIAGRSDLGSLLSGVAESLRRIVGFDMSGLTLHDPKSDVMQGHFLSAPGKSCHHEPSAAGRSGSGWLGMAESAATRDLTCPSLKRAGRSPAVRSRPRDQR